MPAEGFPGGGSWGGGGGGGGVSRRPRNNTHTHEPRGGALVEVEAPLHQTKPRPPSAGACDGGEARGPRRRPTPSRCRTRTVCHRRGHHTNGGHSHHHSRPTCSAMGPRPSIMPPHGHNRREGLARIELRSTAAGGGTGARRVEHRIQRRHNTHPRPNTTRSHHSWQRWAQAPPPSPTELMRVASTWPPPCRRPVRRWSGPPICRQQHHNRCGASCRARRRGHRRH